MPLLMRGKPPSEQAPSAEGFSETAPGFSADMTAAFPQRREDLRARAGWIALACLLTALWVPTLGELWTASQSDPSLSQGPIIALIAAALLWQRQRDLRQWGAASKPGLALLAVSGLIYIAAVWADIDFLKPLALLAVAGGVLWFLAGARAAQAAAGPLGLLLFLIPWPSTLTGSLAFPLQLISSAYAAQLTGMLGIPIQRDGVQLAVMPHLNAPPVYSIIVAQACSGLTSMSVLLALGYLIAYFTPVRLGWRAALVALVIPLTVLLNAIRLTIVLVAGANHRPALAQWVHDHEQPVLVFLCSLGLLGLRHLLLQWLTARTGRRGDGQDSESPQAESQETAYV